MRFTRRKALLLGAAGLASLIGGSLLTRRVEDEIFSILRRNFGDRIADAPDTTLFAADVAEIWRGLRSPRSHVFQPTFWRLEALSATAKADRASFEDDVIGLFLRFTNAVRAYETGTEDVLYVGISSPYDAPCANPLSAAWL